MSKKIEQLKKTVQAKLAGKDKVIAELQQKLADKGSGQQIVLSMPERIKIEGLEKKPSWYKEPPESIKAQVDGIVKVKEPVEIKNWPKVQQVKLERPEWYKDAPKVQEVRIVEDKTATKAAPDWLPDVFGNFFETLATLLGKVSAKTIESAVELFKKITWKVKLDSSGEPQSVIVLDPKSLKPVTPATYINNSYYGGGSSAAKDTTPTGFEDGRKTVTTAGTRVPLSATSVACKKVTVTAMYENTDNVVVGGSTVVAAVLTRQGTPLTPGQSIDISINDLNKIYLDAVVSGEGVTFTYST